MSADIESFLQDLNSSESGEDWVEAMENYVDCLPGTSIEYLSLDDTSFLVERNRTLLVVVETAKENFGVSIDALPIGWKTAEKNNWSYLGIVSLQRKRNASLEILGHIANLADTGTFKAYDEVLFVGRKRSCKLALACSNIVERSKVVLIQPAMPEAMNDPDALGFGVGGHRNEVQKQRVLVAYDPSDAEALMVASSGGENQIVHLPCRHMGERTEQFLRSFDLLPEILEMAVSQEIDRVAFFAQLRQQKRLHRSYWRSVLRKLDKEEMPKLSKMLCESVYSKLGGRVFRRELRRLDNLGVL